MTLQSILKPLIWTLFRLPLILTALITLLVMNGCTMLGMNYASLETGNKTVPRPAINLDAFTRDSPARAALMRQFEDSVYGPWPAGLAINASAWRVIDANFAGGRGSLEETVLTIGKGDGARSFSLVTVFPKAAAGVPVLVSQTFSTNCATFDGAAVTDENGKTCAGSEMDGTFGFLAESIFGRYIATAPVERYLDAGLAYASFYGTDFVPDSEQDAPSAMAALGGVPNPTGTLMAWAFAYAAAIEVLEADPRIDASRTGVIGHSRFGKAALIAGAWDTRVDAVIAHQAGFAGASLSRSETGERLDRMAKSYPHWMKAGFDRTPEAIAALPVDQHQLLALAAPVPVFLGNGRRDVWSDPNSSFRAAEAASPAYEALGLKGIGASDMRTFDPSAHLAWWMRTGGHSVVAEDIDAFLAFLDVHFAPLSGDNVKTGTSAHGR